MKGLSRFQQLPGIVGFGRRKRQSLSAYMGRFFARQPGKAHGGRP